MSDRALLFLDFDEVLHDSSGRNQRLGLFGDRVGAPATFLASAGMSGGANRAGLTTEHAERHSPIGSS